MPSSLQQQSVGPESSSGSQETTPPVEFASGPVFENPERPSAWRHETIQLSALSWQGVSVTVRDRSTKKPKVLVDNAHGIIKAGQCCALMGPSGSGKTTLLNALAKRSVGHHTTVQGTVLIDGKSWPSFALRKITAFVENDEPFISALTVSETLHFASKVAGPRLDKKLRKEQVDSLLESFGLVDQGNVCVGSMISKGISDGEKRRLAVARQLVTWPKILFLDEPTSGLDATASFEVIKYLRHVARARHLIIICSIHQPSSMTLDLFDKLFLMAAGKPLYFGNVTNVSDYLSRFDVQIPPRAHVAEFLLELISTDFKSDERAAKVLLEKLNASFVNAAKSYASPAEIKQETDQDSEVFSQVGIRNRPTKLQRILALMHRDSIKAARDPMAYGIRTAFVFFFAVLLGTIWLHLDYHQDSIQPQTTQIFFILIFMSLGSLIYAPSFIEDYFSFEHDYRAGFYGILEFSISNFVIGLPFLLLISLLFCIVCYFLSNPLHEATAFFNWTLWIFLTSLAADSAVVMFAAIYPNFMFTIAAVSFFTSLLTCSQGFMIITSRLNVFYRYTFQYWDYLAYSFRGMMIRQFADATYNCGSHCQCLYNSTLASQCQIAGEAVLQRYELGVNLQLGKNVAISIAISLGFRLASMAIIKLRQRYHTIG